MLLRARLLAMVVAVLAYGCSNDFPADNPYDPESSDPAPGKIVGVVVAPTLTTPAGIAVAAAGGPSGKTEIVAPVTTDGDGRFVFEAVRPGDYRLEIEEIGFQIVAIYGVRVQAGLTTDLGAINLTPLTETDDASVVQGTATLDGESGHAGIHVRVVGRPFDAHTALDGGYQMSVPEGTYDIEFIFPDFNSTLVSGVLVPRATTVIIEPVVLLVQPATVAGTIIRRTCESDPADEVDFPADGALISALGTGQTGIADGSGDFAVTGLRAGVYTLRASLAGHVAQEVSGVSVRGGDLLVLPEVIHLPPAKGSLEGRVTLSGESNHSGILVQVAGTNFVALTNADGSFRMEGVCAGDSYEIQASRDGFLQSTVPGITIAAGERTVVPAMVLARQQGGLTLNDGGDFTSSTTVTYQLQAPTGTTEMRISEDEGLFTDPSRADEGWVAYVQQGSLTLSGGEGTKTVHAQVRSEGGSSAVLSDQVILDTTAPGAPEAIIEDGEPFSNDPDGALLVTLTATETAGPGVDQVSGLSSLRLINHDVQDGSAIAPSDPADPAWEVVTPIAYLRVLDHPLLRPSTDEQKELWVRFGDRAGNWSAPVSASVTLDRQAPSGIAVSILGSAPGFANANLVTLALDATEENPGLQMRIANTSTFLGASWAPYAASTAWFLTPGDGPKDVWVQFRDAAGNVTQAITDSVVLDTVPPTSAQMSVDQAPYSNTRAITLTVAAQGASEMMIGTTPDFTDASGGLLPWSPFATSASLTLPDRDGEHRVYGKLRGPALNETTVLTADLVLDRAAPHISGVDVLEGTDVSTPGIRVRTTAVAGRLDANEMRIDVLDLSGGGTVTGAWGPFTPTLPLTLPAPSGAKQLSVAIRDAAGNASAPATVEVRWDPDPPLLTEVRIAEGATYTAERTVTVDITASGADEMQVSGRADFGGALWQPFIGTIDWTLPAADGPQAVYVRLRDLAGNEASSSGSIIADRTAPGSMLVAMDGGAATSTDGVVALVLSASDAGSGVSSLEISNDPGFATSETLPWSAPSVARSGWALLPGDGLRTVYVRFSDAVGNRVTSTASLLVDATAPSGAVSIDAGAAYATSSAVTLTAVAPPDTTQLAVADGASIDCASLALTYQAYTASVSHTLPGGDGPKSVSVCLRDAAGNTAAASDAIVLDTTAPTGSVSIDGGAAFATRTAVQLNVAASADTVGMAVANGTSLDCGTASYEAYATTRAWTLGNGDGTTSVTVCLRDAAGLVGAATDDVELDTTPPSGTLLLAGGAAAVTSASITAALTFPADTGGYALADGGLDCATATYTPVAPGTTSAGAPWTLAAGDGLKTVVACLRDFAGNRASVVDTVSLDTSPPSGTVTINAGATHATSSAVVLTLSATPGTAEVAVQNGASIDCGSATFQAFAVNVPWTLPGVEGLASVSVCFRDDAGLVSTAGDTIVVDLANPAGTVVIASGAAFTRSRSVTLTLTASSDVTSLALADGQSLDCATASYEPFTTLHGWTLPSGNGTKSVAACLRDASGRTGSATDGIELDETNPAGTLQLAGGASYVTSTSVTADLSFPSDTDGYALADGGADCTSIAYTPVVVGTTALSIAHTLPPGDGSKLVTACFRDQALNASSAADAVVVDTRAPGGELILDGGANFTTSVSITASFSSAPDAVELAVVNGPAIDCGAVSYQAFVGSMPWSILPADGLQTVSVCYRDAAGLTSSASDQIVLDRTNPTGTLAIAAGAAYARTRTLLLDVTAGADVARVAFGNGASLDCATAPYEPLTASRAWTLPAPDGTKSVTVCFEDAAGRTGSATDDIELDTTPPQGGITLASGASYASAGSVSVALTFPADTSGYALGNSVLDCATATYTAVPAGATTASTTQTLLAGDGAKAVIACLRDLAGNTATAIDTIIVDTAPPAGTLVLAGGATYATTATNVTVTLSAPADTVQMSIVEGTMLDCAAASYGPFSPSTSVNLVGGDGVRTVSACLRDVAGLTASASDTVILDTVNPSGALFIAGGEPFTRTAAVIVSVSGSADVSSMAFADGVSINCAAAVYEPYSALRAWTLPSASDGQKTLSVCLRDAAGRTGTISDSITLDTAPPSTATLVVAAGATHTTSTTVTLSLTTPETVTMALANEQLDCTTATYSLFAGNPQWSLAGADGLRTVVGCLRDAAGWTVSLADSIILDRVPPAGSVLIDGGAATTRDDLVDLFLSASPDTVEMAVFNGAPICANASWGPYSTSVASWDLDPSNNPATDGPHTVGVCLRDGAGLTSSMSASIILDRVSPSGSVVVAGGRNFVSRRDVTVAVSSTDTDLVGLAVGEGTLDCANALYGAFAPTFVFDLPEPDGAKTVIVCLADASGRTAQLSDSVTLDRQPPTGALSINAGATWTTTSSVTVAGTSADAVEYALGNESIDCSAAVYTQFATSFSQQWDLQASEGLRTVRGCLRDAAGNLAAVSDAIGLDLTDPTGTVSIGGGAQYATGTDVTLTLGASTDVTQMRIANGTTCNAGTLETFATTKPWSLALTQGLRTVSVCFNDASGRTGVASDTITLDTLPPTGSLRIDGGNPYTISRDVVLDLATAADAVGMALVDGPSLDCASTSYGPVQTSRSWVLPAGDGTAAVTTCYRDAAGNTASASDDILLDTAPPATPGLTVTELAARWVDLQWTTPSEPDLAGFVLERRLASEGAFTPIASLPATKSTYSDAVVSASLGKGRFYRVAAVDTHGLRSPYSIELGAGVPTEPPSATYMNPYDDRERALGWTRPPGTALLLGTYRYEDPTGVLYEESLPTNAVFHRLPDARDRFDETLVLVAQNVDATLTWEVETKFGSVRRTVDQIGINARPAAIDLGPEGEVHVVWHGSDSTDLRYQKLDGTSAPVIVSSITTSRDADIAVDSGGVAHLAYMNDQDIYYARMDGGAPQLLSAGSYGDIAVDVGPNDLAHIVAWDSVARDLVYILVDSTPTVERPDTLNDTGRSPSIAIDAAGVPHIAYYYFTGGDLKYLRKDGSLPVTLDSTGVVGSHTDIAIDPKNSQAVIAYHDQTNARTKLVRLNGANIPVIVASSTGGYEAIAIDGWGTPHVAYQAGLGTTTLDYVKVDGSDTPRVLDGRGASGNYSSMAVDDVGRAHIVHVDGTNQRVEYIRVESEGLFGLVEGPFASTVDVAVDAANVPTVVYTRYSDNSLRALRLGDPWTSQVVDSGGLGFGSPSVEIDAFGVPYVAYHDQQNDNLKYRRLDGVSTPVLLDSTGIVGLSPSLALGAGGAVHISYTDSTNQAIKYIRADLGGPPLPIATLGTSFPTSHLRVDSLGNPHVIYNKLVGPGNNQLWYRPVDFATAPVLVTIVGGSHALAIDAADGIHVVSDSDNSQDVQHIFDPPNDVQILDHSARGTGGSVQAEIDADGFLHTVYLTADFDNRIGYARADGTSRPQRILYYEDLVPILSSVGDSQTLALAVDRRGVAHIALFQFDGDDEGWVFYMRGQFTASLTPSRIGALDVPAACQDVELFGGGMLGCAGTFAWSERTAVCAEGGLAPCTAAQWVARRRGLPPAYNYWTDDDLRFSGGDGACSVSTTAGSTCSQPMRVCAGATDELGNTCNWTGCGYETTTPVEHFGGCAGNLTAGVLCCEP